jgi:hypothetical protein
MLHQTDFPGQVWGVVTDEEGIPIVGASVIVTGMPQGAVSDIDGRFYLDVPLGTLLEISCIGYGSAYESAASGMEIVLREDNMYLDEVVVIGYGSTKRSLLTGTVQRIRGVSNVLRLGGSGASGIYGYESPRDFTIVPEGIYEDEMPELSDDEFRAVFSEALAFEPCLYPDKDGKVDVTFKASDKLSTYHVNVLAHDPTMRNAVLQRDFVVTVPVKISVTAPDICMKRIDMCFPLLCQTFPKRICPAACI